jgi:phosphatidate cytidylyltransferase
MTRVLSALVLLPVVIGTVWFLPAVATLALATVAAVLAFVEYARIMAAIDSRVPVLVTAAGVAAATIGVGAGLAATDIILMSAVVATGAIAVAGGTVDPAVLRGVAASILPIAYIGLPLGAIAAVRTFAGREAVLLLMGTIVISDSAQYYCGRAFGRTLLAPAISPKKTVEGAVGGLIFGTAAMAVGGRWVFPDTPLLLLLVVSACVTAAGMVGDLFESMMKRSAGVKDSSQLIPGHGGVLDRIDSWLFAAPLYYAFAGYLRL